jgi:hypothetical protein
MQFGCAAGSGFAPAFMGQRPYQGHSPVFFPTAYGEAKPRHTSGGKAVSEGKTVSGAKAV